MWEQLIEKAARAMYERSISNFKPYNSEWTILNHAAKKTWLDIAQVALNVFYEATGLVQRPEKRDTVVTTAKNSWVKPTATSSKTIEETARKLTPLNSRGIDLEEQLIALIKDSKKVQAAVADAVYNAPCTFFLASISITPPNKSVQEEVEELWGDRTTENPDAAIIIPKELQ